MLEYIKGKLAEATPSKAVIEIHGIGHGLLIPLNNYSKLPQIGQEVLLYVSSVIREDSHKDYGFLTREGRDLFEKLIDVSGIGPKTGLALIGHMELADLYFAISQGDTNVICKVPGIGKKTAERLIIDLRDKLKNLDKQNLPAFLSLPSHAAAVVVSDAISALVNLGYPAHHAQKAIKKALDKLETEQPKLSDLITSALQQI
jgi:holliday junction DNA helicase RuvA